MQVFGQAEQELLRLTEGSPKDFLELCPKAPRFCAGFVFSWVCALFWCFFEGCGWFEIQEVLKGVFVFFGVVGVHVLRVKLAGSVLKA